MIQLSRETVLLLAFSGDQDCMKALEHVEFEGAMNDDLVFVCEAGEIDIEEIL